MSQFGDVLSKLNEWDQRLVEARLQAAYNEGLDTALKAIGNLPPPQWWEGPSPVIKRIKEAIRGKFIE